MRIGDEPLRRRIQKMNRQDAKIAKAVFSTFNENPRDSCVLAVQQY